MVIVCVIPVQVAVKSKVTGGNVVVVVVVVVEAGHPVKPEFTIPI